MTIPSNLLYKYFRIFLKKWIAKGREGPKHLPLKISNVSSPYWAWTIQGMWVNAPEVLKLFVTVTVPAGEKFAVPFKSELLRGINWEDFNVPLKPSKKEANSWDFPGHFPR